MKKNLIAILCFISFLTAKADEGMWMICNISQHTDSILKSLGLELSPEEIYSDGKPCLNNAIVMFGGYCSGVVVSPDGLVFTNHHCGYSSIQENSAVGHDYLRYGFLAKNYKAELPNPDLYVDFHLRTVDVTEQILSQLTDDMDEMQRHEIIKAISDKLTSAVSDSALSIHAEVTPYYKGSKYYMSVYQTFSDVRLVCAPPECLGKYGGDTDNWVWPRQTCDFSVFRIYANKQNLPAEYSKDNVPYKTEGYAKVSTQGFKEGDFCMTFGYPGSTDRYMSSYGIIDRMKNENEPRIQVRGLKQDIWKEAMNKNDATRIMYSSKYAQSSNYWKNSIGMNKAIIDLKLIDEKQALEKEINDWINEDLTTRGKYEGILDSLKMLYESQYKQSFTSTLIEETLQGSDLLMLAFSSMMGSAAADTESFHKLIQSTYKDTDIELDRKVLTALIKNYIEQVPDTSYIFEMCKSEEFKSNPDAFIEKIYATSKLSNPTEMLQVKSPEELAKDPLVEMALDIISTAYMAIGTMDRSFLKYERMLGEALRDMDKSKEYYSDANFTLRMSYGIVEGYSPSADLTYKYWTNAQSLIDKNVNFPDNDDFFLLPSVKEWMNSGNFGKQYIDKTTGEMQLCFLTNNDITGGNSGSGMFDSKGRLIGLAFDGNWEAMSSDLQFNNSLTRCIGVDIRYVLSVIEKYSKGKRLIKELVLE